MEKNNSLPIYYIFLLYLKFLGQIHTPIMQENSTPS